MNNIVRSVVLLGALVMLLPGAARGNTIFPVMSSFTPGVQIVYDATFLLSQLQNGDGFTVFDVGGFEDVASVPTGWTSSVSATGSPFSPFIGGTPTDGGLTNVHFVWAGGTVIPIAPHLGFVVLTSGTSLRIGIFGSKDHAPGGAPQFAILGPVPVPVPDQGSTMALLGLAMLSVGLLRRHLA